MERINNYLKFHVILVIFTNVNYTILLEKYAYNTMLFCLPGKHEWKNLIKQCFLAENNSGMIERDFAKGLRSEFDMEIQSEAFRFNRTLSIEGSTCEYHNKYQNGVSNQEKVNIDFTHIFRWLCSECRYYILSYEKFQSLDIWE